MSSAPPPGRGQQVLTAVQRLQQSRAQMRAVLQQRHAPPQTGAAGWRQAAPAAAALVDGLKAIPGVGVVAEALGHWWAQHPLRSVVVLADGALHAVVAPLARRHPYTLAAGALVVGAVLAWSRPWRLARRHGLLNGLGPALVAVAMARMPLQAWFTGVLGTLLQQLHAAADTPAQQEAAPVQQAPAPARQTSESTAAQSAGANPRTAAPATPFPTSANHPPQTGEGLGAPLH